MKKIFLLIFPPFAYPLSYPCGAAFLKANSEADGWQIKALDLNIMLCHMALTELKNGKINNLPPSRRKDAECLLDAADFFLGKTKESFCNNSELYNAYAAKFNDFTHSLLNSGENIQTDEYLRNKIINLAKYAASFNPSAIGLSISYSSQLHPAVLLTEAVKRLKPEVASIFGGSFFSVSRNHLLKRYQGVIDFIITGEGEEALSKLLDGQDPKTIPGVSFIENEILYEKEPQIINLKTIRQPDFSDFDPSLYFSPKIVLPITASRGCYWRKCAFCVHYKSSGDSYRQFSPKDIADYIKKMAQLGISRYSFNDEMIAPAYFERLASEIIKRNLRIHYYALAKPTAEFTKERLKKIRESGCEYIIWGLESGCQRILDLINKGTNTHSIASTLQNATESGIKNHVFVIAGFPTETKEEYAETLNFLKANKNAISETHRSLFALEKGSIVYNNPEKFGVLHVEEDYSDLPRPLAYKTSGGMTMREAEEEFRKSLPFLKSFNPYSKYLGNFREHALILYGEQSKISNKTK